MVLKDKKCWDCKCPEFELVRKTVDTPKRQQWLVKCKECGKLHLLSFNNPHQMGEPRLGIYDDELGKDGYDYHSGLNYFGFNKDGLNKFGFNYDDLHYKTGTNRDEEGFDSEGYNEEGFDSEGYDRDGYDSEGYDQEGYDIDGYDRDGYNEYGFTKDGVDGRVPLGRDADYYK